MGTSQMKNSPGFSSRVREKFQRPAPLRSFVFVEDKSRKYDFVDNENPNWTSKSSLVDRQKLQQGDESQLRMACKLLSDRIDRGEIAPGNTTAAATTTTTTNKNTTNKNTIDKKTTTTDESLRHYNTTDSTEENARETQSMPVISEMLRGLETKPGEPEITVIPQQQETTTRDQQKTAKLITQIPNNDDDNAPQHIEEYDPLSAIATAPDDAVSLDHRKTGLMRRISFFAFGKRKTSESALGHYHQHNKGAVAVQ